MLKTLSSECLVADIMMKVTCHLFVCNVDKIIEEFVFWRAFEGRGNRHIHIF